MRYISIFSGIEAASAAWHPIGWQPLVFSEIERFPSAVLAHHYPNVPNVGDMTQHDWAQYKGQCDLVVGGPPCQAFSIAGLRKSLDDDRGNLSLQFAKAIHAIDPVWAVIENVPGWLSTPDNAFGCMLAALVGADDAMRSPLERGRWPNAGMVAGPRARACWRVLDAQYFGLAQRRERVFLVVGFRDWADPSAVLFESQSLRWDPPPRRSARQGITHDIAPSIGASGRGFDRAGDTRGQDPVVADVVPTLDRRYGRLQGCSHQDMNNGHAHLVAAPLGTGGGGSGYRNDADTAENLVAFGGNNTSGPIEVATACNAHGGPHGRLDFESETFIAHTLRGDGFDASEDGTGRGTPLVPVSISQNQRGEIALALTTSALLSGGGKPGQGYPAIAFNARQDPDSWADRTGPLDQNGHSQAVSQRAGVRRLTPTECERLQGFPDGYTLVPYPKKPAADGPRYEGLGNSMAVPVIRWLGERIQMVHRLTQ